MARFAGARRSDEHAWPDGVDRPECRLRPRHPLARAVFDDGAHGTGHDRHGRADPDGAAPQLDGRRRAQRDMNKWSEEDSSVFQEIADIAVPRRDEMMRTLAAAVPFRHEESI